MSKYYIVSVTKTIAADSEEQALEDALLGYRDHHTYDDAASTPVEIDYTTQS